MSHKVTNNGDLSQATRDKDSTNSSIHITNLPRELLGRILTELAYLDYDSIYKLAACSSFFKHICQDFMKHNERQKFAKPVLGRPAGMSDSEDSDYDPWDDVNEYPDEDDDLLEQLSNLSFGSNLDEERLDDYLAQANSEGEDVVDYNEALRGSVSVQDEEW